jgi:glycosyltransferase involved in cell wall biosynthesis
MKKVLIVSPVVSHPPLAGNSARIGQMVAVLQGLGCEVHFLLCPIRLIQDMRSGDAMKRIYGANYREINGGQVIGGNLVQKVWRVLLRKGLRNYPFAQDITFTSGIFPARTRREFQAIVDEIDPDLLVFEYILMAELARALDGRRTTAVDTHDSFTNRNHRIRASGGAGMWWSLRPSQERRLLSRFDHALAIQQNEFEFFSALLAGSRTQVQLVDILSAPSQHHGANSTTEPVLGYIGSNNRHNIEGLFKFLEHQWPSIREATPGARVVVAGNIPVERAYPGVDFIGRVDDLWQDFYRHCAAIINPCISGTGLKIKTVEAMSYGLPVVTTSEGCNGIEAAIGHGLFCFDLLSDGFRDSCTALLRDSEHRARQGHTARAFIEERLASSTSQLASIVR